MIEMTQHFRQRCLERGLSEGQVDLVVGAVEGAYENRGIAFPAGLAKSGRVFFRVTMADGRVFFPVVGGGALITLYTEKMGNDALADGGVVVSLNAARKARERGISLAVVEATLAALRERNEVYAEWVCKSAHGDDYFRVLTEDGVPVYFLLSKNGRTIVTVDDQATFSAKRRSRKARK